MSRLSLYLMGPLRIELDGETVKLDSHKAIALLIKLALSTQSHPRDALINLLWPERDASRGHTNLRHTLYLLHKAFPANWLQADRETIRFDPSADFWLDVHQFHSYLDECQTHGHPAREVCPACVQPLTSAIDLYRGDFLSGFGLQDSLEFDDWQLIQTETLRREFAADGGQPRQHRLRRGGAAAQRATHLDGHLQQQGGFADARVAADQHN